ncbi:hypothetical protein QYE76_039806 [Lolium multiflorum]|uniref:Uncharacterized protein n=1 Tax=Lolium multiflorum TaxID=4521 RepID=A0AAD8TBM5_LOLMU|nr:hypothetical protein QYE76_039806 [Lolium multiflorum]
MFPGRTRLPAAGAGLGMPPSTGAGADSSAPPATGTGAGRAAPPTVVLDESPEGTPQAPETTGPAGPSAAPGATPPPQPTTEEPTQQEPARDEPARTEGADSRALVRTGTSSASPQGLHVAKGALLLQVPSASDASLGSAATMEQAWLSADSYEVTSREGTTGQTSVEMFFSSLQANLKARAAEAAANVAKVEEAGKAVMDRRTTLYNRAVTHYHKAKLDRIDLARELEAVKVEAAKVPRLESDLRAARAQCGESEEAGRSAARKLKLAEQELTRLRQLEQNHLIELNSLRTAEKEKVDDLSRRLTEVEKQRLRCRRRSPPIGSRRLPPSYFRPKGDARHFGLMADMLLLLAAFRQEALTAVVASLQGRRLRSSCRSFSLEDHTASMGAASSPSWLVGASEGGEELVPIFVL